MRLIDADALEERLADKSNGCAGECECCEHYLRGKWEKGWCGLIAHAPTIGGWVSVKDRLPEENEAVNIVWRNTHPVTYYKHVKNIPFVATGVYFGGSWYWWSSVVQDVLAEYGILDMDLMDQSIEVTHWMPLPKPPEEVSGGEV